MDEKRLTLNISETAKQMGVSRKFLYEHCLNRKDFPLIRIGGKCLVPVNELERWIAAQRGA